MNCKRIISLLLAFSMIATMIPAQLQFSYADEVNTMSESEIETEIITEIEPEIKTEDESVNQENETVNLEETTNVETSETDETKPSEEESYDKFVRGYRTEAHDYYVPKRDYGELRANFGDLPSSYNSVSNLKNNYPVTRNQGNYGTCWAFSAIACGEFDMVKNHGFSSGTTDFSELHLAYFMYNKLKDPLGGLDGDSNSIGTPGYTFATIGGNTLYVINLLAQSCGAVAESAVKYSSISSVLSNGISASKGIANNVACLDNAYVMDISTSSGRADVKKAVQNYGAVSISYYHDNNNYYTHSETGTVNYYSTSVAATNHVVTIVGWDDNYSKAYFKRGSQPKYNGAWLVRNSWTTATGASKYSYFWLSYYDNTIADAAYALDFVEASTYDNNYQYDGSVVHRYIRTEKAANVFTAQKTTAKCEERLKAVRLSFSYDASVEYEIKIYKNLKDINNPESGQLVKAATTNGNTSFAGIYTVPLASEVPLDKGETFAVVVSFPNDARYIDRECTYNSWIKTVAKADEDESFYYDGSKWRDNADVGYGNLCVKALTSEYATEVNKYELLYELNGGVNATENPAYYEEYTDTIKLQDPTREGYHFLGWYLDPEFTKKIDEITYAESGAMTLYAKWEKHNNVLVESVPAASCMKPGTEKYKCSVCGVTEVKQITVPHDTQTVVIKATASRDGYSREVCQTCNTVVKTNYTIYKPTVKISYSSTTYNGKRKKPTVTVVDRMGNKLTEGIAKDYTVSYSNNLYPGKGKVTVKFNSKKYDCTITKTFTIKPKSTYITSLKSLNDAFKVKWYKRSSQITGYQVQYSRYSSFRNAGLKSITSKYTVSRTIKGLKSKKKYYVRVRTYKTVKENGKKVKYYSSWSKVKTVKTK